MTMEKKFILTKTNEEVYLGDTISFTKKFKIGSGDVQKTLSFTLTPDNINVFIANGVISPKRADDNTKNLKFFINSVADSLGWSLDKTYNYLEKLKKIYAPAAFSIILRAIAKYLDKQYSNHISEAEEVWVISLLNGKVCKVNKKDITNYQNFAAFRSKEDALFAKEVLQSYYVNMYEEC